ncbi:lysozyme-like [Rhopalosiphum maidis]|uniref:lysozyme-like n=1 Tax=Rhopalosiphum maidis TaxID=43146 RepID=UPI000F00DABE|nr:lysozyme-like [Rhopalosiphum maidis]
MASHIIFASTVLCLIALSISVTASPQTIGIQKMPVTDACLRCICEGVGQCRPDTKCEGDVCGMFGITWAYWVDSGKPVVSGSKPSDSDAYPKCAENAYCAKMSIINYMNRFSEDCNDDGVVDCYDYAAIHKLGGYGCRGSLSEDFKRRFLSCHNPSIS